MISVLLTFKIFEACADFLTPDGLESCRKRRDFGADPSLVRQVGCVAKTHREAERCVIASSTHPTSHSLIGHELDDQGNIVNGKRGLEPRIRVRDASRALALASQRVRCPGPPDADPGRRSAYLPRTLDIHFVHKDSKVYISQIG